MKAQIVFKRLGTVLTAILLLVVLSVSDELSVYADGESFSNHSLSSDGGVVARYNSATKELTISGAGTVEYDKWVAMAQKINPFYYDYSGSPTTCSWGGQYFSDAIDESDMKIIFSGAAKAIKLCGTEWDEDGLFAYYSGRVNFNGAVDLAPDATDISYMFYYATAFNEPVDFDTSNVTDMSFMFAGATVFDQPVDYDTSNVTDMRFMFAGAKAFNQPVDFDTSNVTDMADMFYGASVFDQPVDFDTSKVEDMSGMFFFATAFNHPVNFDTSNVTDMSEMFRYASVFNQPVDFDTSSVTNMAFMFGGASNFDQPVEFDTSKVKRTRGMFDKASAFNHPVNFDTSNVTTMGSMFDEATVFNQPVKFDTSKVTDMSFMFNEALAFNQPVDFDTSKVTDMAFMFYGTETFNHPIYFDISSAENIKYMFRKSNVSRIVLENSNPNLSCLADSAFERCMNLKYLLFSGLIDANIDGFSGDYFVEENGGSPIPKAADEDYDFNDNQSYKVYLQSTTQIGVPTVSLSKAGSAIKVSWTAVPDATGYQVYRADKNSGPFTKFKTTSGLVYTNAGNLVPGMPYYYKVRAYKNDGGNYSFGDFSDVKGYYAPGELAAPAKPGLSLDKNGNGIRLNWNTQKRITGFQVFRSLSPDKPFSYLQTSTGTASKYTNLAGLTQGRPYYYKIRAYRMAKGVRKYSAFSDIKGMFAGTDEHALGAVSFSLEDNPNVSAPNVRVRWTGVSGADGYCVYRWNSAAQNWTGLKKTGPNARVYTNINGVVNHKTNFYGMRPYHISGGTTCYGNIGQSKGYRVDK